MMSTAFFERFLMGKSSEKPSDLEICLSSCMGQEDSLSAERAQGRMPPSLMESSGSNTARVSTSLMKPRPLQAGQAPCGELKEKECGSISAKDCPVAGSTRRSEKKTSSFSSSRFTSISRSPRLSVISTESVRRFTASAFCRVSGLMMRRSTTNSMLCFT